MVVLKFPYRARTVLFPVCVLLHHGDLAAFGANATLKVRSSEVKSLELCQFINLRSNARTKCIWMMNVRIKYLSVPKLQEETKISLRLETVKCYPLPL